MVFSLEGVPPTGTTSQLGLELAIRVDTALTPIALDVVLDRGTPQERSHLSPPPWVEGIPVLTGGVLSGKREIPVLIPEVEGTHTFLIRVTDRRSRKAESTFTRTFSVIEERYAVEVLEPFTILTLGEPTGINSAGDVSLWIAQDGMRRAFVWRSTGALVELFGPNGSEAAALGLNDVGDVVGSVGPMSSTRAFLWRSNGETRELSCIGQSVTRSAIQITNGGQILAIGSGSCFIDAATRLETPHGAIPMRVANALGQAAGVSPHLYGTVIVPFGGLLFSTPILRPGAGDRLGRGHYAHPLALIDSRSLLGAKELELFLSYYPDGATAPVARYLTQYLPGRPSSLFSSTPGADFLLSPHDDVFARPSLDSLYAWHASTGTRRIRLTDDNWFIQRILAVNDGGTIAAVVERKTASGRRIARLKRVP